MKSKTKPKTNTHTNPEHHTGTPHPNPHTTTSTHPNPAHQPTTFGSPTHEHGAHESLKTKTCEEMETGGFGSFDETMATSNRCTERATEFCNSCGKTLCGVHHDAVVKIILLDPSLSLCPRLGNCRSFNSSCPRGNIHASPDIWAMGGIQVACDYVPAFRLPGMSGSGNWRYVRHGLWSAQNCGSIRN